MSEADDALKAADHEAWDQRSTVSEPLVHVSNIRLEQMCHAFAGHPARTACGLHIGDVPPRQWLSTERYEREESDRAVAPTPTCPKCRIAWDTAVEKAGGAR